MSTNFEHIWEFCTTADGDQKGNLAASLEATECTADRWHEIKLRIFATAGMREQPSAASEFQKFGESLHDRGWGDAEALVLAGAVEALSGAQHDLGLQLHPEVLAMHKEIVAWRRTLHQHPELGFEEIWTSKFIADKLRSFGGEKRMSR